MVNPEYVNLTRDTVTLNDGTIIPPSGRVATPKRSYYGVDDQICHHLFTGVEGLPEPKKGIYYIVDSATFVALKYERLADPYIVRGLTAIFSIWKGYPRKDVVTPAVKHPDCERDRYGNLVSVPCFIQ